MISWSVLPMYLVKMANCMVVKKSKSICKKKRITKVENVEHYTTMMLKDICSMMDFLIKQMHGFETHMTQIMNQNQHANDTEFLHKNCI